MSGPFNPSGGGGSVTFASQAEAEAGVNTTKSMNPLRTAEAIVALGASLPIAAANVAIDGEEPLTLQSFVDDVFATSIAFAVNTANTANDSVTAINNRLQGFQMSDPPETAASPGTTNSIAIDSDFLYVCVAADTWKRVALSGW